MLLLLQVQHWLSMQEQPSIFHMANISMSEVQYASRQEPAVLQLMVLQVTQLASVGVYRQKLNILSGVRATAVLMLLVDLA